MSTLATFNLQVIGPNAPALVPRHWTQEDKRVLSNLPAMLEAVEEDLSNLLPPGYEARIREWSSDE